MSRKLILITSLITILVIGGVAWYIANQDQAKDLVGTSSIGQQTKGEPLQDQNIDPKDETPNNPSQADNNKKDTDGNPGFVAEPKGNFVSSHNVKMDSLVASSCVTTPGATCTITFTNGDKQKSLEVRTTDREGAAYWEWTPHKIGLTPGTWVVEAVASNGDNSKSSKDVIPLEVSS